MRQITLFSKITPAVLFIGLFIFTACQTGYRITSFEGGRVEMTSAYDHSPDQEALKILSPYKAKVDSVMKPIIGKSAMSMKPDRPEGLLSNLIADVLKEAAYKHTGKNAEIAVINIGGLRNDLPKGDISYGDIFEILPFENSLCVVTMDGKSVRQLFSEMAISHGEGISGAKLILTPDGKLKNAWINGREIDENKLYTVATVDYLSEGNDRLTAFCQAKDKICPGGITIRQIFLNYILDLTQQGKILTSSLDGRISIEQ